jgi:tetratricopeptide (TPR) repeat protein
MPVSIRSSRNRRGFLADMSAVTMRTSRLVSLAAFFVLLAADLHALQRPPASCDQFQAAVQADPKNLEAAANLGRCTVRDYEMIALGGDSTRLVFRSSWSSALRALRHAVELEPSYARAYRPLFAILFAETRDGCSSVTWECRHVSPVLRDGDSLLTIPRPVRLNVPGLDTYEEVVRESQASRRANLTEARALAQRWLIVAPSDRRPHEYLGRALLGLGDPAGAIRELEIAATLGTPESRGALFWDRIEAMVKTDQGADARRVLDEEVTNPARDTTRLPGYTIAGLNALLGRYRPPPVDSVRARRNRARMDSLIRISPPASRPTRGFSELLTDGDSVGARRVLAQLDSSLAPRDGVTRIPRVGPEHLWSAESHLTLGDTAVAEARLSEIEHVLDERPLRFAVSLGFGRPWLGPAWLLSGDLAAARGQREAAARMYRRVIGLWGAGDDDLQPVVDQARARLGSLSRRP